MIDDVHPDDRPADPADDPLTELPDLSAPEIDIIRLSDLEAEVAEAERAEERHWEDELG